MCALAHTHTKTCLAHKRLLHIHTELHLSEYRLTLICPKIRIAALYSIEYAFDKCHQQLTVNQLIFALSIMPLIGLRLMLAQPN